MASIPFLNKVIGAACGAVSGFLGGALRGIAQGVGKYFEAWAEIARQDVGFMMIGAALAVTVATGFIGIPLVMAAIGGVIQGGIGLVNGFEDGAKNGIKAGLTAAGKAMSQGLDYDGAQFLPSIGKPSESGNDDSVRRTAEAERKAADKAEREQRQLLLQQQKAAEAKQLKEEKEEKKRQDIAEAKRLEEKSERKVKEVKTPKKKSVPTPDHAAPTTALPAALSRSVSPPTSSPIPVPVRPSHPDLSALAPATTSASAFRDSSMRHSVVLSAEKVEQLRSSLPSGWTYSEAKAPPSVPASTSSPTAAVTPRIVPHSIVIKKEDSSFTVDRFSGQFETKDKKETTFATMLQSFKATHGADKEPSISAPNEVVAQQWKEAIKRVYSEKNYSEDQLSDMVQPRRTIAPPAPRVSI